MRIVLVCPYSWTSPGGVANHIGALAGRLRARGHEVRILAPADGDVGAEVISVGRSAPIRFNGAVSRLAFGPRVSARVRVALRRARPDIVHVHEPFVPSVSMLATIASRAPVVATFHAAADASRLARAMRAPLRLATRKVGIRIAVSEEARKTAERVLPGPYRIVPNGITLERFAHVPARDPGTETVVFFGRLESRKGARVLCEAFGALKRLHPNASLLIAGDGPDRAACEAAVPEPYRNDVTFLGRVSDEALAAVIGQASVVALPALGGESFGIVLLEAMSAGRPVVATNIPGYAAVARHDREAILVPPADAAALAAALDRVMVDRSLAGRLITAGHTRAAEFDWDHVASEVERVYRDAAATIA